ncbi:hypothetical protein PBY51_006163 [Eleginops maclovinus]|uniref:Uncharacterized protein n=1 Tax=Eleginops maclovinus TaxID=56733 RepID=A0AAN7ZVL8_ELEMC|nr:hypothetical protein PBY51_006163 [Eleginops maclovinus]
MAVRKRKSGGEERCLSLLTTRRVSQGRGLTSCQTAKRPQLSQRVFGGWDGYKCERTHWDAKAMPKKKSGSIPV